MTTFIQDWKNFKNAKKTVKDAKAKKTEQFNKMLTRLVPGDYLVNAEEAWVLPAGIKTLKDAGASEKELKEYLDTYASKYHACACFFVYYDLWDYIIDRHYQENKVERCINNYKSGMIVEEYCDGCENFKDLVAYQALNANYRTALRKRAIAKQKLISHFLKQKTK